MKFLKENLASFFEEPTRDKLREIIEANIGELDCMDFKKDWIDLSKLSKHILAIANSGGGCIIIGVEEDQDGNLISNGVESVKDKADIMKGIEKYLPSQLKIEVVDFKYNNGSFGEINGKSYQVIFVEENPEFMPYISKADGDGIKKDVIYVRRGTNSVNANYDEIQQIIDKRVSTKFSSTTEFKLEEHLAQLKVLYNNIPEYNVERVNSSKLIELGATLATAIYGEVKQTSKNSNYPEEDYEEFINRMIRLKKKKIERVIEVQ